MESDLLKARLDSLPEGPGVYRFLDGRGKILYVGKAKNLRNRVRSYFQSPGFGDPKIDFLRRKSRDLDCIVTDNEVEALILESTLVKKHQPRLNVRLKDDKSFLHIKLTVNEPYPRVLLTRRIRDDGALYFGPYLPASLARNTIKIINRHFLLRTCDIEIDGKLDRPCLEYYIKRCLGPCVEGLCTAADYARAVQDVILLLEGRNDELTESLRVKMMEASDRQHFEAAAFYRDRLGLVEDLAEKQKMATVGGEEADVFAYYREGPRAVLQLFTLRGGRVAGKREFYWEELEFFDPAAFLRDALQQYYLNAGRIADAIYLPTEIEDQSIIAEWLTKKRGFRRKVRLSAPRRGEKHDLLLLVERNAKLAFESRFKIPRSAKMGTLKDLQAELDLPRMPLRIEAFDVSNIQGDETVASLVVCQEGAMRRGEYRKFRIRSVESDDFRAIFEAVRRRYRRLAAEGKPLPDLILIDGGRGQLHFAYQALSELGKEEIPLAAIAKKEERIYVRGQSEPLALVRSSPALHLLQEIRDEAHRFAVSYHRKRRALRDFSSELDEIPGIGEKRKKRLLQNFGSVARIRRASIEELIPYLGEKLARRVQKELR
jgi:excinuclease ABC subunit C